MALCVICKQPCLLPVCAEHEEYLGMMKLWEHCQKFIKDQNISCPEAVIQSDRVILNAYEFIEGCCDIVGYQENEDED